MDKDIFEVVRENRLKKIDKQIRGSEAFETAVRNNAAKLKRNMSNLGDTIDLRKVTAQDACSLYYTMLADYNHTANFVNSRKINKSAIAYWSRLVKICQELQTSPKDYLQAQFSYFHLAFGKAPDLNNLLTEKAVQRAKDEVKLHGKIVATAVVEEVPMSDIFRMCDKQVRDICRAQKLTREEFYEKLVLTGEYPLPVSFLEADPVYRKVLNA